MTLCTGKIRYIFVGYVQTPCKYTSIARFAHLVYQVACFGKPDIFQNSTSNYPATTSAQYSNHSHNLYCSSSICLAVEVTRTMMHHQTQTMDGFTEDEGNPLLVPPSQTQNKMTRRRQGGVPVGATTPPQPQVRLL